MIKVWFGSVQHFMLLDEVPWTYTPQSCRRPKGVLPSVVLQYANLPLGCRRGTGTCLRRCVVFPVCTWATRRAPHPGGTMVISGHCCFKAVWSPWCRAVPAFIAGCGWRPACSAVLDLCVYVCLAWWLSRSHI